MSGTNDKPVYPFGVIPAQVFMDERLTLETMRVLGALYTFRDKHTSLAFPSRDELSSRCTAMHPSNISEATTKLVELGWLVKEGKGGNSRATRYTIRVPDVVDEMAARHRAISETRREKRVAEQATVAQSATVAEQAIPPVADEATRGYSPAGYTQRVAQQATRIEQTNGTDQLGTDQVTEAVTPKKSRASKDKPSNFPLLAEVEKQVISDFLAVRDAKNLPLTETALKGIKREADKLGYTLEQALTTCCERGWAGFKADWILKEQAQAAKVPISKEQEKREATERARARIFGANPTEKDITHEATRL